MPENKNGCSCCPYGYHIDLDFVDFIECINKGINSREKETANYERHHYNKLVEDDGEKIIYTDIPIKYINNNNDQVYATPYENMSNYNSVPRPNKLSISPNSRSLEDISKNSSSFIHSPRDRFVISPISRNYDYLYSPSLKNDIYSKNGSVNSYIQPGYGSFRSATTTPTKHYNTNTFNRSGYHSDYGERYTYSPTAKNDSLNYPRSTTRSPSRMNSSGYESSKEITSSNSKPDYFTAVAQTMSQIRSKSNPGINRNIKKNTNTYDMKKVYASKPPLPVSSVKSSTKFFDSILSKKLQSRSLTPTKQHPYRSGNIKIPIQNMSSTVYEKDHYFPASSPSTTEKDVNSNIRSYTSNNVSQKLATSPSKISTAPQLQSYIGSKSYTGPSLIDDDVFASIRREKKSNKTSDVNSIKSPPIDSYHDTYKTFHNTNSTEYGGMMKSNIFSPTLNIHKNNDKRYGEENTENMYDNEYDGISNNLISNQKVVEMNWLKNNNINKNNETNSINKNNRKFNLLNSTPKEDLFYKNNMNNEVEKREITKENKIEKRDIDTMIDDDLYVDEKTTIEKSEIGVDPIEDIMLNIKTEIINEYNYLTKQNLKEIGTQTENKTAKVDKSLQADEMKVTTKDVCCGIQVEEEGYLIIKKSQLDLLESRSCRLENLEKEIAEAAMRKAEIEAKQEYEDEKMKAIEMAARAEADLAMSKAIEAIKMKDVAEVMRSVDEEMANEEEEDAEIVSLTHNDDDEDLSYINPTPDYSLSINGLSTGSSESDSDSECIRFKKNSISDDFYFEQNSDNDIKDIELLEFEQEELNVMKEEEKNDKTSNKSKNNNINVENDDLDDEEVKEKDEKKYIPKLLSPEKTESLKKLLTDTSVNSFHRGDSHRSFRLTKSNANDLSIIAEKHTNESGDVVPPTSAVHDPRAVLAGKVDLKKDASLGVNSYMNGLTPIPINFPNIIPRPKITRINLNPGKAENKEEEEEAIDRVMPLPSEMRKFGYFKDRNVYNDRRYRYLSSKKAQQKEMEDDDNGSQSSDTSEDSSPDESPDSTSVEKIQYEVKVPLQEALRLMLKFVENPATVTPSVADWAIKYVKHEWMRLTTKEDTDIEAIAILLEYIRDVSVDLLKAVVNLCDQNDNTALHFAIANSKFDVVSVLLDSHVCEMDKPNKAGYSAIMIGATTPTKDEAHASIIDRLFRSGNVNARSLSHGQTALMLAVSCNNESAVKALLDLGADVNIQDFEGSTALMVVAEHGHVELAKILLDHPDIDTSITDCDEQTALSIAVGNKYHSIAALIYAYNNHTLKKKEPSIQ
uniref:ANK_REP_REGION domain-containing protein n=1 Tax=Strongyloides papillosus TaxID=174720 RepID=A0A0N5BY91_STREA